VRTVTVVAVAAVVAVSLDCCAVRTVVSVAGLVVAHEIASCGGQD
jgi:hypothetical protein